MSRSLPNRDILLCSFPAVDVWPDLFSHVPDLMRKSSHSNTCGWIWVIAISGDLLFCLLVFQFALRASTAGRGWTGRQNSGILRRAVSVRGSTDGLSEMNVNGDFFNRPIYCISTLLLDSRNRNVGLKMSVILLGLLLPSNHPTQLIITASSLAINHSPHLQDVTSALITTCLPECHLTLWYQVVDLPQVLDPHQNVMDLDLLYLLSSSNVVDDDDEGISADTVLAWIIRFITKQ